MASGSTKWTSFNKGVKGGYVKPSRAKVRQPRLQSQAEAGTPF